MKTLFDTVSLNRMISFVNDLIFYENNLDVFDNVELPCQ